MIRTISTEYWSITFEEGKNAGPVSLVDKRTGIVYADQPYIYDLVLGEPTPVDDVPINRCAGFDAKLQVDECDDKTVALLAGQLRFEDDIPEEGISLEHKFILYHDKPWIDEQIILTNNSGQRLRSARFAFAKAITDGQQWDAAFMRGKLYGVPFLVDTAGPFRNEYSIWNTIGHTFATDGWVLTGQDKYLTIIKHSQDLIQSSVIDSSGEPLRFQFGGISYWPGSHLDLNPDTAGHMAELRRRFLNGEPIDFGINRYCLGDGGWKEGYAAFKEAMRDFGHGLPSDYDPGVHIEPFYDYPWEKFTLDQLDRIITSGKDIGCEVLYLDPKWNDEAASTLWDTERLGPLDKFIDMLETKYGLRHALGLHIMGSNPYYHDTARSVEDMISRAKGLYSGLDVMRVNRDGSMFGDYCNASRDWIDEKVKRLCDMAEQGMSWFMFDFQRWNGPCYSPNHGHPVPSTREMHSKGLLEVVQRVREKYPNVKVEMHDTLVAGVPERLTPMYYLHGLPNSLEECWGFEYMHFPLSDLLDGRAMSLYYYNLAYEIPLYLHINMTRDNSNCLAFWWFASTIRHLGIGGYSDPEQIENYKKAMAEYMPLKEFFTRGAFYGIDPCCHIHALSEKNEAVAVVFNISPEAAVKECNLPLSEFGLNPDGLNAQLRGGSAEQNLQQEHVDSGTLKIICTLPAMSAAVLHIGCHQS